MHLACALKINLFSLLLLFEQNSCFTFHSQFELLFYIVYIHKSYYCMIILEHTLFVYTQQFNLITQNDVLAGLIGNFRILIEYCAICTFCWWKFSSRLCSDIFSICKPVPECSTD